LLKLRNPWGEKEWNGRASESDAQFWKKMNPFDVDRLGYSFQNDGTFFMLWEDFV
jgi:calpain-5